jgi:hypothetical protein
MFCRSMHQVQKLGARKKIIKYTNRTILLLSAVVSTEVSHYDKRYL